MELERNGFPLIHGRLHGLIPITSNETNLREIPGVAEVVEEASRRFIHTGEKDVCSSGKA